MANVPGPADGAMAFSPIIASVTGQEEPEVANGAAQAPRPS
jgi:hypothetical protein